MIIKMTREQGIENVNCVLIDPRCKFNYASYFIEGLIRSGVRWKFSLEESFKTLMTTSLDYKRGFGMIVELLNGSNIKVYIDDHDTNDISEVAYDWCDVYASVNIDKDYNRSKVLPTGPTCALRLFGPVKLLVVLLSNIIKIYRTKCYHPSVKRMLLDYYYTIIRRLPYSSYSEASISDRDYCFALSTLWHDDVTDGETNNWRLIFTKICKKEFPVFEGGFFKIPGVEKEWPKYYSYNEKYEGLTYNRRIPLKEYLTNTRKSAIVFNTPAVELCLGWKLSEYLMMGKAIISTPISNILPGEFKANEHFILVTNEQEIEDAVKILRRDDVLREKLERNGRRYFEDYLTPSRVIERILHFASTREN